VSDRDLDVLVVGAGICGLAAAYALTLRGARVLVVERAGVGAEQSAGLARIFRVAHVDPRLCALALEARDGWRRWERELGVGRLLGDEGLVALGPSVRERQGAAMTAAAAPWEPVPAAEAVSRVPALAADHPFGDGLWDPLAGAIRVRRTLDALAARVSVRAAEVRGVRDDGDVARVELAAGSSLTAGHVVVCAGTETVGLAAGAGIELPMRFVHHVRLSYAARGEAAVRSACLIAGGAYGLPLGSTGRFGLGLADPGDPVPYEAATADAFAQAVRAQHASWVPAHLPGLDPRPVDEVRCVGVQAPFLDEREDGFQARRAGRVIAFAGSNLMKFGPLVGDRLAQTVLDRDDVHPDLA